MEILERNINTQIKQLKNENIVVRSTILDLHHSMLIEMEIDITTREIVKIYGDIIKSPYPECHNSFGNIQNLVGLKLERGLAKKISENLGKNTGCTHMVEIAINASRTASYAILTILSEGKMWKDIMQSDEERYDIVKHHLDNSCVMFKR